MPPETIAGPPRTTPAFVWGYNNRGGLGLGHTAQVRRPVATMLPAGTVDVQGGINFTVALTESRAAVRLGRQSVRAAGRRDDRAALGAGGGAAAAPG